MVDVVVAGDGDVGFIGGNGGGSEGRGREVFDDGVVVGGEECDAFVGYDYDVVAGGSRDAAGLAVGFCVVAC